MAGDKNLVIAQNREIQNMIYTIRGKQVMGEDMCYKFLQNKELLCFQICLYYLEIHIL